MKRVWPLKTDLETSALVIKLARPERSTWYRELIDELQLAGVPSERVPTYSRAYGFLRSVGIVFGRQRPTGGAVLRRDPEVRALIVKYYDHSSPRPMRTLLRKLLEEVHHSRIPDPTTIRKIVAQHNGVLLSDNEFFGH